jgi:hypothetical protein
MMLNPVDAFVFIICDYQDTVAKIGSAFPNAVTHTELVSKVTCKLNKYGYGKTSLLATSLCSDEVNRHLEKSFTHVYGDNFSLGGLGGFPFGGVTAFGAMAHHIPDGGSCLVLYGPHVGVNVNGEVGTVDRRGRDHGGACCGSGVAASGYVSKVFNGEIKQTSPPSSPLDAEQTYVASMLLPFAERLEKADDRMVELPYAMFEAQDELMGEIMRKGCGEVSGNGKIALLGGIEINTPAGTPDYFLPLRFDIRDNSGALLETFQFDNKPPGGGLLA